MKTLLLSCSAVALLAAVSACTTVVEKPSTHTTTTEEVRTVRSHPMGGTVTTETQTGVQSAY